MTEQEKTQGIRLADVLLIGPLLIYAGTRRKLSRPVKGALVTSGVLTIIYNGLNYMRNL